MPGEGTVSTVATPDMRSCTVTLQNGVPSAAIPKRYDWSLCACPQRERIVSGGPAGGASWTHASNVAWSPTARPVGLAHDPYGSRVASSAPAGSSASAVPAS